MQERTTGEEGVSPAASAAPHLDGPMAGPLEEREPTVTLWPRPPVGLPRVVGPGRVERGYCERIEALDLRLARARHELDLAALVERGSTRLLDRLEHEEERAQAELLRARTEENRLLVLLGALQRDNERLHERATHLESRLAALPPPRRPGLLARLLDKRRPRA